MRSLLVTGGAGFIGSNFVRHWSARHPADRLTILDCLTYAGNPANIFDVIDGGRAQLVVGSILDEDLVSRLMAEQGIDTVVHFAAESHVDRSILHPRSFVETNVLGTQVLLEAALQAWKTRSAASEKCVFHHVSTDEVYGSLGMSDPPFREPSPYRPNSPYAASKAGADHLVRAYARTYGLPVTISNCSNNYGPFQFPEKFIPLLIVNSLTGRSIPVYGDGGNIRDWLHVRDHCRAIDVILAGGSAGETYAVGGSCEVRNIDLARTLCSEVDRAFREDADLGRRFPSAPAANGTPTASLLTFVSDRKGHDLRYSIDPQKVRQQLNFEPEETLETGLASTLRWYLDNESWWRAVMDGSYQTWIQTQYGKST